MTARTRAQLNSDADSALADNAGGEISAADVRQRVKDIADSALFFEDIDTSTALGASDTKVPSQKAVKAYADALLFAANALRLIGTIDCSTSPNYPAAYKGYLYVVSVAGKIGGASGVSVDAGDELLCIANTSGGDQATVGANWAIIQANLVNAYLAGQNVPLDDIAGLTLSGNANKVVAVNAAGTHLELQTAAAGGGNVVYAKSASATNLTISSLHNGDTVDGAPVATGDTILLKNQTAAAENGLYVIGATAGTTARLTGFTTWNAFTSLEVFVRNGAENNSTQWFAYAPAGAGTLGTDNLYFGQDGFGANLASSGLVKVAGQSRALVPATAGTDYLSPGNTAQNITGGARITPFDNGTKTSGTFTPDPGFSPHQVVTNGGAHTLAPGANYGDYILDIIMASTAGAITTSSWTKVSGDSFSTTIGNKFRCFCSVSIAGSSLVVLALQ